MRGRNWLAIGASISLGLIFVAAGLGKLPVPTESYAIFSILPEPLLAPIFVKTVASLLPRIELILGLLFIVGIAAKFVASCSSVLIAIFIFHNFWMITGGLGSEPCNCFGEYGKVILAEISVLEALYLDAGMLVLVLIILFYYPGNFFAIRPWFLRRR